jgi:uncharacterized protein (TIGR03578 family)
MIENQHVTVTVSGKGNTKEEAVSRALSKIQKQIFSEVNQLIIRAEPANIEEMEATIEEYTERFFFFFMPRKRMKCNVTLKVEVDLKTMDSEKLNWKKKGSHHSLRRGMSGRNRSYSN